LLRPPAAVLGSVGELGGEPFEPGDRLAVQPRRLGPGLLHRGLERRVELGGRRLVAGVGVAAGVGQFGPPLDHDPGRQLAGLVHPRPLKHLVVVDQPAAGLDQPVGGGEVRLGLTAGVGLGDGADAGLLGVGPGRGFAGAGAGRVGVGQPGGILGQPPPALGLGAGGLGRVPGVGQLGVLKVQNSQPDGRDQPPDQNRPRIGGDPRRGIGRVGRGHGHPLWVDDHRRRRARSAP
jgi:hypothetical protein